MAKRQVPKAGLAPQELAALAHLRYVSDQDAGFARERNGHGFVYVDGRGRRVRDPRQVARFERLAIPPAWREVWICRLAGGHLQATGRDSRRRKQYVYHPRWSEIANLAKFRALGDFGPALPALRRTIANDMRSSKKLTRARILAGVVGLLDATSIRIGNEEYVVQNGSYGLTTLRDRHVTVSRSTVEMRFVGKGGFRKQAIIDDKELVKLIKQSRAARGARLFQFEDEAGKLRPVTAADVNEYLHEATGKPFTAKDFRTWKASALAAGTLYEYRDLDRMSQRRRILKTVVDEAAASLGNTPTVCRNYYIHPGLLAAYQDGSLAAHFTRFTSRRRKLFSAPEQAFAHFLRRWEAASELASRSA